MAEDLLDAAQVGAAFEQVGGGAVTQAVRSGLAGSSPLTQALVHNPTGGARIQPAAAHAEEQGRAAGICGQDGPARL